MKIEFALPSFRFLKTYDADATNSEWSTCTSTALKRKIARDIAKFGLPGVSTRYHALVPCPSSKPGLWFRIQQALLRKLQPRSLASIPPHLRIGIRGEHAALFELGQRGYTVVARRWTSTRLRGDIDLIGWNNEHLCFIEVKTRSTRDLHPAESAVDDQKRRTVRNLARAYLRAFPETQRKTIPVRFDVISVYLSGPSTEFDIFPGAFGWD